MKKLTQYLEQSGFSSVLNIWSVKCILILTRRRYSQFTLELNVLKAKTCRPILVGFPLSCALLISRQITPRARREYPWSKTLLFCQIVGQSQCSISSNIINFFETILPARFHHFQNFHFSFDVYSVKQNNAHRFLLKIHLSWYHL